MRNKERSLHDDILRLVLLKLVLLAVLWWVFFRGGQVTVDGPTAAQHLVNTAPSQHQGEAHVQ